MATGLIIILVLVAVVILFAILLYNSVIRLNNQVKNSWAQIDVQLKRRNDLIPNLIETVKGYAKHEKTVFTEVTKARTAFMNAGSMKAKAKASNMLSSTLKSLFAVSENYPQLKANENFLQLQEELAGTENKIAYSRQHYNDMVMEFNTKIQVFPNNMIANMMHFKEKESFETPAEEKKPVKVKFDD
ncbi:MAG: LemA family protein [Candidatus Woesearchaeota archaeon]